MTDKQKKPSGKPYKAVEHVKVYLWDKHMGSTAFDPAYGFYVFSYTPEFIKSGVEPAPIHMPLSDEVYLFPDLPDLTYKRLPALLSDALPDDFGNSLVNRYMADRGVPASSITALDRLAYMGNRAMGAMTFKPATRHDKKASTVLELGLLVEEARKAVHGEMDTDDHTNAALRSILDVGTSAGGARAKAVIAWNRETEEIRSGQMDVPDGFEHWLLKFDGLGKDSELGVTQDYGRIEYAYYEMARAAGIKMMESRLLQENGRAHFMTKRFDRDKGNVRHHVQTLCAMNHVDFRKKGTNSYSQLFATIELLGLPYEDKEEAFRRMVFNVMTRNCDDHSKNMSFILKQGSGWALAPAYDMIFAHNPEGEWTSQHLMSVNGKFKGFVLEDFLSEADRFGVGTARRVINEVALAVKQWYRFAEMARVSPTEIGRIWRQMQILA